MSKQVVLEFPIELPDEDLHDPEILKKGKKAIVLELLRKGVISQDSAAEMLEIDRHALFDLMSEHNIPGIDTTGQELRPDLSKTEDPTLATSGTWKELLDCETFEREVYESRQRHIRPEVRI